MNGIQRFLSCFLMIFAVCYIVTNGVAVASSQCLDHGVDHGDGYVRLRPYYRDLPAANVQAMQHMAVHEEKEWGFYGHSTIKHDYELASRHGDKVVVDHATGLMWHQSGSTSGLNWEKANQWIRLLNQRRYAGYSDWRLPTIEEASSLLEPGKTFDYLPYQARNLNEERCELTIFEDEELHGHHREDGHCCFDTLPHEDHKLHKTHTHGDECYNLSFCNYEYLHGSENRPHKVHDYDNRCYEKFRPEYAGIRGHGYVPDKVHEHDDTYCDVHPHKDVHYHRLHQLGPPAENVRSSLQDKQLRVKRASTHKHVYGKDQDSDYRKHTDRFINPIFDPTQGWIWTGDSYRYRDAAWRVDFFRGLVDWDIYPYIHYYVRPVRSMR